MGDGALESTERHFLSLLDSASDGISIRLLLFSLPGVPRSEAAAHYMNEFYSSTENLWDTRLDGLIVTGREPLTSSLAGEPYWASLTRVVDWAQVNTYSTVWSCLAAHAALLHLDGIGRVKGAHKHCGVFECEQLLNHPLTAGAPSQFSLPHSRWNGVSEDALKTCGYSVLTRSAVAGVDTFVKHSNSLFVFFQGHPEYESNTLLLEYRRDVGRYLKGEIKTYPSMPYSYFGESTVTALATLREEALSHPREELLAEVSTVLVNARIENTWQATAACIYRNWLEYIRARKQLRLGKCNLPAQTNAVNSVEPALTTAVGGSAS
jgi:homoserine O-succinyltransferase